MRLEFWATLAWFGACVCSQPLLQAQELHLRYLPRGSADYDAETYLVCANTKKKEKENY